MSFKLFFEYLVRTDGRSQIGMVMSLTGLTLNVVFDYIFVVVFRMGTFWSCVGNISFHYSQYDNWFALFSEVQSDQVL